MDKKTKPVKFIRTAPYPGFPTDLQSPLLAALCTAEENSCIEECVFENRFLIVKELLKMGADIYVKNQTAYISPVEKLFGSELTVKDLRGGAALVVAALEAEGKTIVDNAEIIFRGYEDISSDLENLGAVIRTIS